MKKCVSRETVTWVNLCYASCIGCETYAMVRQNIYVISRFSIGLITKVKANYSPRHKYV